VAYVGDGNNDGKALKRADIGFSFGKQGTEISRKSASIIFMDDNLEGLVESTIYGRNIFENLQRFLYY
jgi:Ca2+-transporting ATPase